jgi:hypothetical protein
MHNRISAFLFKFKDIIANQQYLDTNYITKNLVTKIFCRNNNNNEQVVILCSISDVAIEKLLSIVAGCFDSIGIRINSNIKLDTTFCESLSYFLSTISNIQVCLDDNTISLRAESSYFEICTLGNNDRVANEYLLRSICILLAICNKNVSNNVDSILLNEYGVANKIEMPKNEELHEEPLI